MADDGGMMSKSTCRLSQNPFAIKTAAPTRSLADSTEGKDSSICVTSSSPKVFLRPSALAAQAEKLKTVHSECENNRHQGKENTESKSLDSSVASSTTSQSSSLFSINKEEAGTSQAGFVFGQNLHERVITEFGEAKEVVAKEPLPSELTFEAAASLKEADLKETVTEDNDQSTASLDKPSKSLTESAEEYQSKQVKRKFSEVTVVTGEEEESNVLQISCKLFSFNKTNSSWLEKGRGILRLNDKEVDGVLKSRLVMRTHGSLRVVLNTKVWAGMTVEHPSAKTVRISALDPEGVKVYLVMAGTKDIDQLFSALDWRVTMLKSREERHDGESNSDAAQSDISSNENPTASFADSTQGGNANNTNTSSSSNSHHASGHAPKRWRSDPNSQGGVDEGDQPESSTASGSISPAEGDLSSDSGFPAAEDS